MTTRQIQDLLRYLGYDVDPDGIPGPQTEAAVREFQRDYGFQGDAVDGIPGAKTQMALKDSVAYDKFRPPDVPDSGTEEDDTFWAEIPNFTREEFRCKCGGKYCDGFPAEPREDLVRLAQAARTHFDGAATVVSGLRCPQWNAMQGGVEDSQHIYGEACDLRITGVTADRLLSYFLQQPGVRYAYKINDTNVHFDVPKGDR